MSIYQVKNTITRSGSVPISASVAKNYCKVDNTTDDTLFDDIISNAVEYSENYTNQQINTSQSIVGNYIIKGLRPKEEFYELDLLYGNSTYSISSITKELNGEASETISADFYWTYGNRLFIQDFLDGYFVKVTYTATTSDTDKFRIPLLKIVSDVYIHRENDLDIGLSKVFLDSYKLLDPYKSANAIL